MQLPYILPRRGQNRPWTSLPRINWQHPLAQGLVIYTYDAGDRYVDLCNPNVVFTQAGTKVSPTSSKVGGGQKFTGNNWVFSSVSVPAYQNFGGTAPFTFACGSYFTANASTTNVGMAGLVAQATTFDNASPFFYIISSTSQVTIEWDDGTGGNNTFTQTISPNSFQTWMAVVTSATSATMYASGKLEGTSTFTQTTGSLVSEAKTPGGMVISNGSCSSTLTGGGGIVGFVPYFAGWNRALSSEEARLLHDDPYCFLTFVEDEMFSTMVGVAAAAFTLSPQPMIFM